MQLLRVSSFFPGGTEIHFMKHSNSPGSEVVDQLMKQNKAQLKQRILDEILMAYALDIIVPPSYFEGEWHGEDIAVADIKMAFDELLTERKVKVVFSDKFKEKLVKPIGSEQKILEEVKSNVIGRYHLRYNKLLEERRKLEEAIRQTVLEVLIDRW